MARRDDKDDSAKRRRRREEEAEAEAQELAKRQMGDKTTFVARPGFPKASTETTFISTGIGQTAQLQTLIKQALVEIERVHQLYQKFFTGVDKVPPLTARANFDALITSIDKSSKMTAAIQFQVQALMSRVRTYREKWDKQMLAREGK